MTEQIELYTIQLVKPSERHKWRCEIYSEQGGLICEAKGWRPRQAIEAAVHKAEFPEDL